MRAFSVTIGILFAALGGENKMPISTSVIVIAIIALLTLIVSFIGKFRWLTLISIFLFLIAAWMMLSEILTGTKF